MVHRFLGRRAVAAAVVVCGLLVSSTASAFCRTTTCNVKLNPTYCNQDPSTGCWLLGAPLFWEQGCISYSVQWNGSPKLELSFLEAETLVGQAFSRWSTVSCTSDLFGFAGFPSISATSLGPSWCVQKEFNPEGPNANTVIFVDEGWSQDPTALAITTVSFNAKTGRIFGADLEVNSDLHFFDRIKLSYVLTHEVGHFLGLDHSRVFGAVMDPEYQPADGEVTLAADDIQAICTAYVPGRVTPACDPEPDNGYASDCGGDVQAGCALTSATRLPSPGAGILAALLAFGVSLRWARAKRRRGARVSA